MTSVLADSMTMPWVAEPRSFVSNRRGMKGESMSISS